MLIAQITDLHVRPEGKRAYGRVETNAMLRAAVDAILRLDRRPDAVIASGDLTECGLPMEYAALRDILVPLPMPVYLIPGNHDRRAEMRAAFADHAYLPEEGEFLHYVVEEHPVRLIGLDTVVPGRAHGTMCADRLEWLEARLAEKPDAPTVIFMHHPPFPTGIAAMDRINCRNGDDMARIVAKHPNVERVLAGHHHRPIQIRWAGTIGSIAPSTAHQVELGLADETGGGRYTLEPAAFHLHLWARDTGVITHQSYTAPVPGPYEFTLDPDYPAHDEEAANAAAE
jgi:Icc protein